MPSSEEQHDSGAEKACLKESKEIKSYTFSGFTILYTAISQEDEIPVKPVKLEMSGWLP